MLHPSVPKSRFSCLRQTAPRYSLPDPLQIMVSPQPKLQFKSKVKSAIKGYWHVNLVRQAASLPSLRYLRLNFLPLCAGPHPVWWICGSSASAVRAAMRLRQVLTAVSQHHYAQFLWFFISYFQMNVISTSMTQLRPEHVDPPKIP